jgi:hypothetical protein
MNTNEQDQPPIDAKISYTVSHTPNRQAGKRRLEATASASLDSRLNSWRGFALAGLRTISVTRREALLRADPSWFRYKLFEKTDYEYLCRLLQHRGSVTGGRRAKARLAYRPSSSVTPVNHYLPLAVSQLALGA